MAEGRVAVARLPPLSGGKIAPISSRGGNNLENFQGPIYKVHGRPHALPPPRALKPYVDTKAGELDTWPSHASGQAISRTTAMLSKNKNLVLVDDEEMGKPQMVPKPRFLQQLDNFLKKELRALGVTDVQPSELRLQAHREVFEYLIEDFKTYRPLLSAIKNEYEMMLAYQRQQIRDYEPLKQMLVTVSEQCDQKVMAIRDEERKEISDLKIENKHLQQYISSMRNEKRDLEEQVIRLQQKLEEEYKKYRDECDARKLLVSDINDLRYQHEDYLMSKQNLQDDQDAQEDPVMLKIALKKAREDEMAASQRLNEMVANYGDVIPRRDYETLETSYKQLKEQNETTKDDFKLLKAEHSALLEVQKQITQQRDEFYVELETLKRSSTPRPDWTKCADYIQGGTDRWKELSEGKRSDELVSILLQEIGTQGLADPGGADYFDAQGTGDSVPVYLRHDGPVRNRKLGKRDCALLIRDIWREKAASDAQKTDGKRDDLATFLHEYLKSRFALDNMVVEWAYNLHDAVQRYSTDENIDLFWRILSGQADEEIYHSQLQIISQLLNQMTKTDVAGGNTGNLSHEQSRQVLQEYFPGISEDTLQAMIQAAMKELEITISDAIEYKNLFMEDDEGNTGPFLDEVKKFMKQQREEYIERIKQKLGDTNPVPVDDLKRAITLADKDIENDHLDKLVIWAFDATEETLYDCDPADPAKLLDRLLDANIKWLPTKKPS